MSFFENKNERQVVFNEIKGRIDELNDAEIYCSMTLKVGHENPRMVNLLMKKPQFQEVISSFMVGDKVVCKFYVNSRFKNERWYTTVHLLDVRKDMV